MKKTIKIGLLLFAFLLFLSACTKEEAETPYSKSDLTIGVIGEVPEIQIENIELKEISLYKLTKETLKNLDGVLVMEDQLAEASKRKYVKFYQEADMPFFFVGSKMGAEPFLDENLAYDEENFDKEFESNYAYGFHMKENDTMMTWTFGLYNDKESPENIENVITRIFKTIGGEQIDMAVEPK